MLKINSMHHDNKGFSLVEVLACVVIVSAVFLIVSRTFATTAVVNGKAHMTQQAAALAQECMEEFQAKEVSEMKTKIEGAGGSVISEFINSSGGKTDAELIDEYGSADIFTKWTFTQPGIRAADGTKYDLKVVLDPMPYSSLTAEATAKDTNTEGIPKIEGVDAMKNPVIASQINRYDSGAAASVLDLISADAAKTELGETHRPNQIAAVNSGMKKTVTVKIQDSASSDSIDIIGNCKYEYNFSASGVKSVEFCVYSATFELHTDSSGNWTTGGTVYLFPTAVNGNDIIRVENESSVHKPFDIYLVKGANSSFAFQKIYLSDGTNSKEFLPDSSGRSMHNPAAGVDNYKMNIISNITPSVTDPAIPVYKEENQKLRCYEITVTLTKKEADGTVTNHAQLTSTKVVY